MADSEFSMQDKSIQGFLNALNNLPLLISVFTGKTSMLLRQKPSSSEEAEFLDNLKVFIAANAKKITDMLLWMLPNEIEVDKITIDTETNVGKIYFDELAQQLATALANGKTSRPLAESVGFKRSAASSVPKIEFELGNGANLSTAEIKDIADKLCEQFNNDYELTIKVKM